jgi:hypothetical protein
MMIALQVTELPLPHVNVGGTLTRQSIAICYLVMTSGSMCAAYLAHIIKQQEKTAILQQDGKSALKVRCITHGCARILRLKTMSY